MAELNSSVGYLNGLCSMGLCFRSELPAAPWRLFSSRCGWVVLWPW